MSELTLDDIQPLSSAQRDNAEVVAMERIKSMAGAKPTRAAFRREHDRLWRLPQIFATVIFFMAAVVSSIHIAGRMAMVAGDGVASWYTVAHQISYIFMAELAMITFLVMFGTNRGWRRWVYAVLAVAAAVFVVRANWLGWEYWLESIMPPAFTIGTGFMLEHILIMTIRRERDISQRYNAALDEYEHAQNEPQRHPKWRQVLRESIYDAVIEAQNGRGKKERQAFISELSPRYKLALVQRELAAMDWSALEPDNGPSMAAGAGVSDLRHQKKDGENYPKALQPALMMNGNGQH